MNLGHWQTTEKVPGEWVGFVYVITSPLGKKYIGRKNRYIKQSKRNESKWQTYTGSSKELHKDMIAMGYDQFTFQLIRFCKTLGELAIEETKEILNSNALFSDLYYNKYCYLKLFSKKDK